MHFDKHIVDEHEHDGVNVDISEDDLSDRDSEADETDSEESSQEESGEETSDPEQEQVSDPEQEIDAESEVQFNQQKQIMAKDPLVRRILSELVEEKVDRRVSQELNKYERRSRDRERRSRSSKKRRRRERSDSYGRSRTPRRKRSRSRSRGGKGKPKKVVRLHRESNAAGVNMIKSPSDTTIYAPALMRGKSNNTDEIIDKISDFVEGIQIQGRRDQGSVTPQGRPRTTDSAPRSDRSAVTQARDLAERTIVEAEKFKAQIAAPKGLEFLFDKFKNERDIQRLLDTDDEFFHVSCHIDEQVKSKIARGDYIELDRLLPKDKFSMQPGDDLDRKLVQLITKDGHTYLSPAQDSRGGGGGITSIRKWEHAFRTYAAIYTEANPDRSSEIWQYIYTINVMALSYQWDNVAFYDTTFRQLMATKPWRNWAKTYTQGWNIAFRNPISNSKNSHINYAGVVGTSSQVSSGNKPGVSGSGNASGRDWRDDCCWRFNKTRCEKTNSECRYDHRCTFCAGWNHGRSVCRKRNKNVRHGGSGGHSEAKTVESSNSSTSASSSAASNKSFKKK